MLQPSGREFVAWGFNYDHDRDGRLIEDYWDAEWATVEADLREMKALGANVARVHLQVGRFLATPDRVHDGAIARLQKLIRLARRKGVYLDLTGLGCYHRRDTPDWYDRLNEGERWRAQATFWEAVASAAAGDPAVFCFDLMNEPILPGANAESDWLAGEFGGKHFVQRITLALAGRRREDVAAAWVRTLVEAIRRRDQQTLVTVGVIPWAMMWPGARPVFYTEATRRHLDFVSIHVYPESGRLDRTTGAIQAYDIGKPLVIEEIFPLKCRREELAGWMDEMRPRINGWISFYWGMIPTDYAAASPSISDAIVRDWLEWFRQAGSAFRRP